MNKKTLNAFIAAIFAAFVFTACQPKQTDEQQTPVLIGQYYDPITKQYAQTNFVLARPESQENAFTKNIALYAISNEWRHKQGSYFTLIDTNTSPYTFKKNLLWPLNQ